MNQQEPDPGTPESGSTPRPSRAPSGSSERNLIEEAFRQAQPRTSAPGPLDNLPPEGTFPGYDIVREIHRGGQGVVYLAIQVATKRKVALKVLHEGQAHGSSGKARFDREVAVLAQLNHPNIVRLHDSGTTESGSFFYVMDYIPGRTLDEIVRAKDKLPVEEILRLFIKIGDAINAAHLKGIIHRDLKPANIRLDTSGEPIIVDFGLAKLAIPEAADVAQRLMTMTGQFIGSLPWASPEQAQGSPSGIDVRTDVYSLGVILYQMMTGKFPYDVIGNMRDVLDNILRAEPARPSTIRRQVNAEVETIILKCLAKDPERRYQNAGELARDIRHYLAGEPIEAKRDSGLYVLTKTLRRYRLPVTLGIVALVALVGFAVSMSVLYRAAERARVNEQNARMAADQAREEEATQRSRADENFKAGHALAMRMMFEINDEITDLRGATRARDMILGDAAAYLERLRTEAGDDPALLLDLAEAYDKVGDLQGGLGAKRSGSLQEAQEYYRRASGIREELRQRLPDNPAVLGGWARGLIRQAGTLSLQRKYGEAIALLRESVGTLDRALALFGTQARADARERWESLRAEAIAQLGDELLRQGEESTDARAWDGLVDQAEEQYAIASRYWRERLETNRNDDTSARALGVLNDRRANVLAGVGRVRRAEADAAKKEGKPEASAIYQTAIERFRQSGEAARQAMAEFERLAKAAPASGALQRDLYLALHNVGLSHMEVAQTMTRGGMDAAMIQGEHERALLFYERALTITRSLASTDSKSLEALRDVAICLNKVGNQQRDLARLDDAAMTMRESLEIRRSIFATDPTQRHERDLGVGYYKAAQLAELAADAQPEASRRPGYIEALDLYEQAMARFHSLRDQGVLAADHRDITTLRDAMEGVRAKISK